jgi:hydroxyacylglutathione hydrolase
MDLKISSTIGYERARNPLLAEEDEDRFVERAIAGLGPQPPNFRAIVALNRGPLLTEGVEVGPLTPRQVERARLDGALIVDVRTDQQFDEAHIPGAISIPMLGAGFGTRLAWLADRGHDTLLVGRDDADAADAARLAVAVGVRRLGGFLAGGMTSWRQERRAVARIERLPLSGLADRVAAESDLQILDVREEAEHRTGLIPGSLAVPWHELTRLPDALSAERPVAVVCASGQRAGVASSLLQRLGAQHVVHVVDGGVPRWRALGHPVRSP